MNISNLAAGLAGRSSAVFKKHGPTMLTAAGITGFGVTTVLVGKAVLRSQEKAKTLRLRFEEISTRPLTDDYNKHARNREASLQFFKDAAPIVRDFLPAIAVGAVSVTCVVTAHGMLKQQRAALVAAYATLDSAYRAYRKRVQQEIGEERELELYRHPRRIESIDPDTGEACEIFDDADLQHHASPYAKFFDETSVYWKKTPEFNLTFLLSQQQFMNDRLRLHGFLFLNEVYEALGLPRTQAGQVVGWKYKKDGSNDGFVSFGIHDIFDESSRAFVNGYEHTILLDFNVDGLIKID
jgi:Family of unknown function (DUF6353)